MDRDDLVRLRNALDASQGTMAEAMGLPFRTYQAIENGQNPIRPVHEKAAMAATLRLAVDGQFPEAIGPELRELIEEAEALIAGRLGGKNAIG